METWLDCRDDDWLAGIEAVALDPFRGYANGLLAQLLAAGDPLRRGRRRMDGQGAPAQRVRRRRRLAARRALVAFYRCCAEGQVPEVTRLARTISWQHEVLAYHTTWLSNGPIEAANLLIQRCAESAYGFSNFDNYRLRLLLRCGVTWQTRPAARNRGRQPRFVG